MKPFDLDKAKAGAPVITRDGRKARILSFDLCNRYYPLVAAFKDSDGDEGVDSLTNEGKCLADKDSANDLFMAPVKREGWLNLYPALNAETLAEPSFAVYATKEQADQLAEGQRTVNPRIACVRIEWEE